MGKHVYMLEDDSDDRYLTKSMLEELGIDVPITFFSRSEDLFRHLSPSEPPSLILVDFNISPDNGLEVLKKIKSMPLFSGIPFVILSDSDLPKFRKQAYELGASSYITKPANMQQTKEKIGTFFKYWLEVVET